MISCGAIAYRYWHILATCFIASYIGHSLSASDQSVCVVVAT